MRCLTDLYPFLCLLKSWSRAAVGGFVVIRPGTGALVSSTGHFQRKSAQNLCVVPIRHRTASALTQLRVLRPIRSWMLPMNGRDEVLQFAPSAPAAHYSPT